MTYYDYHALSRLAARAEFRIVYFPRSAIQLHFVTNVVLTDFSLVLFFTLVSSFFGLPSSLVKGFGRIISRIFPL